MLVMLDWLWRFWMMCIVVMAIVPVMHYAINLMLCEMTLLAMSMFVKAMLAFLHVLVHLLVHFRTCLGVISNHMTATMFVMRTDENFTNIWNEGSSSIGQRNLP